MAQLKPETLEGFNRYVKTTEALLQKRNDREIPPLWLYDDPGNRARALNGEIVTERLNNNSVAPVVGGIIHDWVGAMFIPGVTMEAVLNVLQDFNRHKQIYPEVIDSRLIKREGNTYRSYLRLKKQKILTVVLDTEHEASYLQIEPNRWFCRSYSQKIAEVSEPETKNERDLPPGEDHGFLWRLNAYWQLEKVKDGVFVECRALSLTRDVPSLVSWIINPIINDLPGDSLRGTLEASRKAVQNSRAPK
jgi:L-rhamnose mutarotase